MENISKKKKRLVSLGIHSQTTRHNRRYERSGSPGYEIRKSRHRSGHIGIILPEKIRRHERRSPVPSYRQRRKTMSLVSGR
jgi:hypothetical protein